MKVENAEHQLYLLRSELEAKIKNTCVKSSYDDISRQPPLSALKQVQPSAEKFRVATVGPHKRVQQSPFAKTGVTPPLKRLHPAITSIVMTSPLQSLSQSPSTVQQSRPTSDTSVTPPHKCPPPSTTSIMRCPLQLLAPKLTTAVPHAPGTQPIRRELFPKHSIMSTTTRDQLVQEEIKIPVYGDIERDPDEDIKVSNEVCMIYNDM